MMHLDNDILLVTPECLFLGLLLSCSRMLSTLAQLLIYVVALHSCLSSRKLNIQVMILQDDSSYMHVIPLDVKDVVSLLMFMQQSKI